MANVAVLNAIGLTAYAFAPLPGGKNAFSRVVNLARELPGVDRLHLFTDDDRAAAAASQPGAGPVEVTVHRGSWDGGRLFRELGEAAAGHDDLFYVFTDCPLLDLTVAKRMHASHRRYYAEYTFADGYPRGITPEILRGETIPRIAALLTDEDERITRDMIFTVLSRDINAFDVETELAPKDLRLLRVELFCDTLRNFRLTERIMQAGGRDEQSVLRIVESNQEILRTVPSFYELQVTEAVSQSVTYLPQAPRGVHPEGGGREMPFDRFAALAAAAADLSGEATVSLSLWGEPALHSRISDLATELLGHERLELLIETSGVGWRDDAIEAIGALPHDRITWIVDLDASTRELYEALRGPGWEEAQATCSRLIERFPGRVHVQAVRMKENEEDLESFYRYWKERIGNVIIQKYDWFCGFLPQKKVADLSPLVRLPCWHLKRDVNVLVDGSVPLCREDLRSEHLLGNVFEEPLAKIWEKGEDYYRMHIRGDYPALCKSCDEYYTFNF